jgi:hypothetical protein
MLNTFVVGRNFVYSTESSRKPENGIICNSFQYTGICNEGLVMKLKNPLSLVRESSLRKLSPYLIIVSTVKMYRDMGILNITFDKTS